MRKRRNRGKRRHQYLAMHTRTLVKLCGTNRRTAYRMCVLAMVGDFSTSVSAHQLSVLHGIEPDPGSDPLRGYWRRVYVQYSRRAMHLYEQYQTYVTNDDGSYVRFGYHG